MYHKDRVEQMHQISEEEPAGAAATTTEEEPQEASTTTTTTARDSDNETKYRAEEKEVESIGEVRLSFQFMIYIIFLTINQINVR